MTIVTIKHGDEPVLTLPESQLKALNLRDGDQATVTVKVARRRPTQGDIEAFLALGGVFADDEAFDSAMRYLDSQWEAWNQDLLTSV